MLTVHQVREQIKVCRSCDLFKVGNGPVPFSGPAPNLLAVVGEAPGSQEDKQGEPFIGPAGTLLRECLTGAGLDPKFITFINTVSCWPDRTPTVTEINACSSNLLAQLQFTAPAWVVLLGNVALSSQRPDLKISRARGKVLTPPGQPWKMFVTFHPSFALRQMKAEKILRADLSRLAEMLDGVDSYAGLTDDSCCTCGASIEDLVEHDEALRFDRWNVPYCAQCWPKAPQNQQEEKAQQANVRVQERKGQLFR